MSTRFRRPLLDLRLSVDAKETDNKLRWDTYVAEDDTKFSIYIPKWRVPRPWPSRIYFCVTSRRSDDFEGPNLSPDLIQEDGALSQEPIVATARRYRNHTRTVRFRPLGDPATWEIGEPYIPYSLLEEGVVRVRLIVFWDLNSRGEFFSLAKELEDVDEPYIR